MKFEEVLTLSVAALLIMAVAALPLAGSQASAQIVSQMDDSFSFDDTMASNANTTSMSFLFISGMSMVEGVEVTGVVMNSENEVSVTIANDNKSGEADAVTVVAFAGTMDIMSMLSSGHLTPLMNETSFINNSIAATYDDDIFTEEFGGDGGVNAFGNTMEDPTSMFENMKMGSSVVEKGWNSLQSINVTLAGNNVGTTTINDSDTTLVFVMIVPYTEETTGMIED